ncbi:hypothetical protein [Pseudonocardia sp. D17]|uniref:hypothetical protein n=1 Tax=Pseudonocardia sp. D17 TaxID=882661 RepID=UPI0030CD0A14
MTGLVLTIGLDRITAPPAARPLDAAHIVALARGQRADTRPVIVRLLPHTRPQLFELLGGHDRYIAAQLRRDPAIECQVLPP